MRKYAALGTCVALPIAILFIFPMTIGENNTSLIISLLIPIAAFAFALAVYTGHITSPWFSSLAWLLNGIVAIFFTFGIIFDGATFAAQQPIRFAIVVVFALSAILNSLALYPRAVKANSNG
jgi:hypothetical protein